MGDVVAFGQPFSGRFWQFNENEDDALQFLPHADQVLYLRGFRANMDFDTGRVGERQRVSYRYFRELLEVRRRRGSTLPEFNPTRDYVRGCIARLIGAGLVVKIENPAHVLGDCMVFFLPLAHVGSIRKFEEPHRNPTGTPPRDSSGDTGAGGDMNPTPENDTNPRNQYTSNNNSTNVECENSDECSAPQLVDQVEQNPLGNCPHSQILSLWQKHFPGKSQPNGSLWVNSGGAGQLRTRWREAAVVQHRDTGERLYHDLATGLEWWDRFLGYLAQSDLLRDSNWFDFRWLIRPTNFSKALEGKYHG